MKCKQLIKSTIQIQRLKGELPLEVEDLEDESARGIENRITRTNEIL